MIPDDLVTTSSIFVLIAQMCERLLLGDPRWISHSGTTNLSLSCERFMSCWQLIVRAYL